MIKSIHIRKYKKLSNIDFEFTEGLNAISGTNGTCKSSLLHIFSNAFKTVKSTDNFLKNKGCVKNIKKTVGKLNQKIETLTRGDSEYNDPAHGVRGVLYTVKYDNDVEIGFRRHNSVGMTSKVKNASSRVVSTRYAVKPQYAKEKTDRLPSSMVIYLGLTRLIPYGEYCDDVSVSSLKYSLPDSYKNEIVKLYRDFTSYDISVQNIQDLGGMKNRTEFKSCSQGIDSNTVSAGEDNLYVILTSLVCLHYYYDSVEREENKRSILLIDELDATLHPAYQIKLLNVFRDYSEKYKIQIVFTTHSLDILDNIIKKRENIIYLIDNLTSVVRKKVDDVNAIRMYLASLTKDEIYRNKIIPIFTEDKEARFLLEMILDYLSEDDDFAKVRRYLHLVDVNCGAEVLKGIFNDDKLLRMTISSICILDGDHFSEADLTRCIMTLPGKNADGQTAKGLSPEELLIEYSKLLYETDQSSFWCDDEVIDGNYGKGYFLEKIEKEIEKYESNSIKKLKRRDFVKDLFNRNERFFGLIFGHWLKSKKNKFAVDSFKDSLKILFKKVAVYNQISPSIWK